MSELKNITLSKRDLYSPVAQLVLGDRKTSGIRFNINRFDGGVDLSGIGWSVKILAADGSSDVQTLTAEVTDMWVLLDWVFPAIAASSVGETTIEVEGVGGNGTKVWQSGKRIIRVIDDLDAEPGYEEEDVTLLQQAIETATVKVEALDSSVNDMVSDLYDLSDSLDALEDRVDTAEASVASTATQAQTTINNLVSGAQTTVGNLYNHTQARYNELNGQVEELSDTVEDLNEDVTGLQGSVATAVGNANTATANANSAASSANSAAISANSAASSANTAAGNATSIYNTVRTAYESGDFNGSDGDDGVSPTVAVTETTSGHRVTITDANGNHQFDVSNGTNGQDVTSLEVVSSETITVPSMAEHNALSSTVSGHTGNGNIHVTANEKSAWNAKADASTVTAHTGNSTIHVTADDKAKWDGIDSISGELTEIYTALDSKQDVLVAGSNVTIAVDGKTISVPELSALKADFDDLEDAVDGKQDKLVAGTGISIAADGKTISATGGGSGSGGSGNIMDSDSTADLDISDGSGNVIFRLDDGNIRTKRFHSGANIVTVKKDGSGDFTTLKAAIDSITDANSINNPYVIEVYPGTYAAFDGYTSTEINTATGAYTDGGFVGLMLTDGMSIRGIGNRDEIVIHGELDSSVYEQSLRNNVSTINMTDTGSLENITVTAKNIRYCVHDDFAPTLEYFVRTVKDCKFRIDTPTSGTEFKTWGEGTRQGKTTIIEACDFGTCFLWHSDNQASAVRPTKLIMRNCTATLASISVYNHSIMHEVYLYDCNFMLIKHGSTNVSSTNFKMSINGTHMGAMVSVPADVLYTSGDIVRFATNGTQVFSNGTVVKPSASPYWRSGSLAKSTSAVTAYGVVVGTDSEFIYVQKSGYLNANRLSFDSLADGDRITLKSDSTLEVNGSGDLIGVVSCVTANYGTFIKLCV